MNYSSYKRIIDVILSVLATIILFLPFLIWLFLKLVIDGRPIFFIQNRVGRNFEVFKIYKLRTLTSDGHVTALGSIERRLGIDEWPQIWQIFIGKMSWVGPRPLLPQYNDHYSNFHKQRFLVRPGITGWAQVHGRNTLTWKARLDLDVEYIQKISIQLDIKILILTFFVLIRGGGEQPSEPFTGNF